MSIHLRKPAWIFVRTNSLRCDRCGATAILSPGEIEELATGRGIGAGFLERHGGCPPNGRTATVAVGEPGSTRQIAQTLPLAPVGVPTGDVAMPDLGQLEHGLHVADERESAKRDAAAEALELATGLIDDDESGIIELTNWETEFLIGVVDLCEREVDLTPAQRETLDKIERERR